MQAKYYIKIRQNNIYTIYCCSRYTYMHRITSMYIVMNKYIEYTGDDIQYIYMYIMISDQPFK